MTDPFARLGSATNNPNMAQEPNTERLMGADPLPEFGQPPLEEVVMGLQFEPLKQFSAAHLGLYWSRIRDRYPSIQDNPPLAAEKELPELKPAREKITVRPMLSPVVPRSWYISGDKTRLIQLQNDQFFRNWRRVEGSEAYPRFATLFGAFRQEWDGFSSFAKEEGLGETQVNQCELTYINHIDKGAGWESFADLGGVFTPIRPPGATGILSNPEVISWSGAYRLPDGRGRLHIDITPAFRGRDFKMTLQVNLRTRGAPAGGSDDQIVGWFEMAHEWVVRAFDELTQPTLHTLWKKRS